MGERIVVDRDELKNLLLSMVEDMLGPLENEIKDLSEEEHSKMFKEIDEFIEKTIDLLIWKES